MVKKKASCNVVISLTTQHCIGAYHVPSLGSLFKKDVLFLRTFSKGGEGGGAFLSWCFSPLWQSFRLNLETGKECKHKGQVTPPKRMNFLKSSKRPLNHPSFSENHVANFPSTSCSKSPVWRSKIRNIYFWNERIPTSELFRKFIRFGGETCPLVLA